MTFPWPWNSIEGQCLLSIIPCKIQYRSFVKLDHFSLSIPNLRMLKTFEMYKFAKKIHVRKHSRVIHICAWPDTLPSTKALEARRLRKSLAIKINIQHCLQCYLLNITQRAKEIITYTSKHIHGIFVTLNITKGHSVVYIVLVLDHFI